MKMTACILVLLSILFCFIGNVKAEPTPAIAYLMDEPVSLFDLGLYRLNLWLASNANLFKISDCTPESFSFYDWDTNKICIRLDYQFSPGKKGVLKNFSDNEVEKNIEITFEKIKNKFGISTGKNKYSILGCSIIFNWFQHSGYSKVNEPTDLCKQLDAITTIEIMLHKSGKAWHCQSQLMGTELLWLKGTN